MLLWWTKHFSIQLHCLCELICRCRKNRWWLVTLNMFATYGANEACYTDRPQHTQDTYTHISPLLKQNISVQKKCWGTQRWDQGLCFVWTDSHGKLGADEARGQKWGFIPLMMWIPARPLSAHTNCLWASSHSTRHFFCRDFRSSSIVMVLGRGRGEGGGTADKTTQQNPPMQMTQNGSTLNKHKYTL